MYDEFDAPWPVSNRDFVFVEKYYERDDGILICNKSIDGVFDEVRGIVRGDMVLRGFYSKKISDSVTEFMFVAVLDPKGSIPNFLKNMKTDNVATALATLRSLV